MLTLASNSKVLVLEKTAADQEASSSGPSTFTKVTQIDGVSDNVSCVRVLYLSESKQVIAVYGTYNGRINTTVVREI